MELYYFILLLFFTVVGYYVVKYEDVATLVLLIPSVILIEIKRRWLMIKLHPKNPFTNFIMSYKMKKLAQQLHKELNESQVCDE